MEKGYLVHFKNFLETVAQELKTCCDTQLECHIVDKTDNKYVNIVT